MAMANKKALEPEDLAEFRIVIADDDRLCVSKNLVCCRHHQPRNVRNAIEDEIPIGANQAGHIHILVENAQIITFAD